MSWMDKGLIFNKRVGPNKHVGWNLSKPNKHAVFLKIHQKLLLETKSWN